MIIDKAFVKEALLDFLENKLGRNGVTIFSEVKSGLQPISCAILIEDLVMLDRILDLIRSSNNYMDDERHQKTTEMFKHALSCDKYKDILVRLIQNGYSLNYSDQNNYTAIFYVFIKDVSDGPPLILPYKNECDRDQACQEAKRMSNDYDEICLEKLKYLVNLGAETRIFGGQSKDQDLIELAQSDKCNKCVDFLKSIGLADYVHDNRDCKRYLIENVSPLEICPSRMRCANEVTFVGRIRYKRLFSQQAEQIRSTSKQLIRSAIDKHVPDTIRLSTDDILNLECILNEYIDSKMKTLNAQWCVGFDCKISFQPSPIGNSMNCLAPYWFELPIPQDLFFNETLVREYRLEVTAEKYQQVLSALLVPSMLNRKRDLALFCIENGADPNAENSSGITPLFLAACSNDLEMVRILISNGANRLGINSRGETGYDMATKSGNQEIAEMFKKLKNNNA